MKQQQKRVVSALLVLVMVLSLFSGLTVHVHAASYVYNWGTRGTTATELSDAAVAFYEKNQVTYEDLAALAGHSDINSTPSSALYGELQELMVTNHTHVTTYDETRNLYKFTDCQNGGGAISSFYSGKDIGPAWDKGDTWNREHTWPQSKGLEGADENDIMMLRPTAKDENGSRGNKAYGESSGFYDPNSVSGGNYNLHGDVARIFLYVYVRWGIVDGNNDRDKNGEKKYATWGEKGVIESKEVLLKWMKEDPVDTWELERNDIVQSITGTRNVFVDYPELAFVLFDEEVPDDMDTPSGEAKNTTSYAINAITSDAAMGTVSVSGSKIIATPKEGFAVSGYEVTSGTATVTQNGNIFTVKATSDCTIQINFEAAQQVSLTYMDNGVQVSSQTAYTGDVVTLPGYQGAEPDGYNFLGWTTDTVSNVDVKPEYYEAGTEYAITDARDLVLHALYSFVVVNDSDDWTLVTNVDQLSVGAKVVVASVDENYALGSKQEQYLRGAGNITKTGNTITFGEDVATLTLGKGSVDNSWSLFCTTNEGFLYASHSTYDNLQTGYLNAYASFSIDVQSDGIAKIVGQGGNSHNHMRFDSSKGEFSCYTQNSTKKPVSLYIQASDSTKYATNTCAHATTKEVAALDATCTTAGYTSGILCTVCNVWVSGHEPISTLGHNYKKEVIPPTETEQGYNLNTCSVCGHSYKSHYVDPVGKTFIVSFSVPEGVAAVESMSCNNTGITLPKPDAPADYFFLGWTEAPLREATTVAPNYHTGAYTATSDITLYALYYYVESADGATPTWTLVTDASQLTAGSEIVLAASNDAKQVVSAPLSGAYLTDKTVNFSEDLLTITTSLDGAQTFTLGGSAGAWTLMNKAGQKLGATAVKKLAYDKGTTTWTITIAGNNATIQNTTDSYGRFLYNVNSPRFTTYTSNTSVSMLLPRIYMLSSGGTMYYTTGVVTQHEHSFTNYVSNNDATCTADGTKTAKCDGCDEKDTIADVGSMLKHSFTNYVSDNNATCTADGTKTAKCDGCDEKNTVADVGSKLDHTGGIATCHEKATCDRCKQPYGEVNPNNHTGETEVRDEREATCTVDGYTGDTYCVSCKQKIADGETVTAPGHAWDNGVVTKEPTETETGVRTYTCGTCGDKKTEDIPVLGHTHKYETKVTAPTCTERGYTTYSCSCGDSYKDNYVDAAGHKWDNGKVTTEPTETATGTRTYTCGTCGETKTESIPALGHTHKHEAVVTAPTCTENGYTTYTCSCGDSYKDNYVDASGHKITYVVQTEPTTEADGVLAGSCENCDHKTKIVLPKLNKESYTYEVIQQPTADEPGVGRYVWTTEYGTFSFDVALEQLQTVVLGDTDGNGKIQTNDAKLVLQYVVKMPVTLNLDAADVDGNGKIQTNDAKLILQYVVKIITQFPTQNA